MSFDFTPAFTHGVNIHDTHSNEDLIQALNHEYNNNAAEWNQRLPWYLKPDNIGHTEGSLGIWPAAITYATWWKRQFGTLGPGESEANPFEVPLSPAQKSAFLSKLGDSCNTDDIMDKYRNQRGNVTAIENTYYTLLEGPGQGPRFTWENGCLCINDRYNFEGIGDFGGASLITAVLGAVLAAPGTPAVIIGTVLRAMAGDEGPDTDPFTIWKRDNLQIAGAQPIFLKNCFCPDDLDENGNPLLCSANEELYRSAIDCGLIEPTISNACFNGDPCIEVGAAQPSSFLGFPYYPPFSTEIITNGQNWSYGGGGNYPKPFTSFSQKLVESNNYLGPFAKFGNISGRLITIPSGVGAGTLGFVCQDWYGFDDGPYAGPDPETGDLYPSKAEWWETCVKTRVTARFLPFQSRPFVDVEVAAQSFTLNTSPMVYSTDYPIAAAALGSITAPLLFASLPSSLLILI